MNISMCREEMITNLKEMRQLLLVGIPVDVEPLDTVIEFLDGGNMFMPVDVMGVMRSLYIRAIEKRNSK